MVKNEQKTVAAITSVCCGNPARHMVHRGKAY